MGKGLTNSLPQWPPWTLSLILKSRPRHPSSSSGQSDTIQPPQIDPLTRLRENFMRLLSINIITLSISGLLISSEIHAQQSPGSNRPPFEWSVMQKSRFINLDIFNVIANYQNIACNLYTFEEITLKTDRDLGIQIYELKSVDKSQGENFITDLIYKKERDQMGLFNGIIKQLTPLLRNFAFASNVKSRWISYGDSFWVSCKGGNNNDVEEDVLKVTIVTIKNEKWLKIMDLQDRLVGVVKATGEIHAGHRFEVYRTTFDTSGPLEFDCLRLPLMRIKFIYQWHEYGASTSIIP